MTLGTAFLPSYHERLCNKFFKLERNPHPNSAGFAPLTSGIRAQLCHCEIIVCTVTRAQAQRRKRRPVMALGILLACCPRAFALNPSLDISQYAHTAWRIRDGF